MVLTTEPGQFCPGFFCTQNFLMLGWNQKTTNTGRFMRSDLLTDLEDRIENLTGQFASLCAITLSVVALARGGEDPVLYVALLVVAVITETYFIYLYRKRSRSNQEIIASTAHEKVSPFRCRLSKKREPIDGNILGA